MAYALINALLRDFAIVHHSVLAQTKVAMTSLGNKIFWDYPSYRLSIVNWNITMWHMAVLRYKWYGAESMAQVVETLTSKGKVLSSNFSTAKYWSDKVL
jgi:hypothetical protein